MNRKISAHYIFTGTGKAIRNGIIKLDEEGRIVQLIEQGKEFKEQAGVEFYNGIIVPGFVNAHCHLELSHLKNHIPQHTGLHQFVGYVSRFRDMDETTIRKAMAKADFEMQKNGIVAVGDISNSEISIVQKKKSKIEYHSFIEVFSLNPELAEEKFFEGKKIREKFRHAGLKASIVPHAPYSLSKKLFALLSKEMEKFREPVSIHHQECASENELFKSKSGKLFDTFRNWGIDFTDFYPTGKNSTASIINYLPKKNNSLLVHNTFSKKEDIEAATKQNKNIFWTFCPNANLYIENRLPDFSLFYREKQTCCIGTDSLASNTQLSVLEELKTIQKHAPEIPLAELIQWATLNGARALNLEQKYGSFKSGKKPGVLLIDKIDYQTLRLTKDSKVKVLI